MSSFMDTISYSIVLKEMSTLKTVSLSPICWVTPGCCVVLMMIAHKSLQDNSIMNIVCIVWIHVRQIYMKGSFCIPFPKFGNFQKIICSCFTFKKVNIGMDWNVSNNSNVHVHITKRFTRKTWLFILANALRGKFYMSKQTKNEFVFAWSLYLNMNLSSLLIWTMWSLKNSPIVNSFKQRMKIFE